MGGGSRCAWCEAPNRLRAATLVTKGTRPTLPKMRPHTLAAQHDAPPNTDGDQYHEQGATNQKTACEEKIVCPTSGCEKSQQRKKEDEEGHSRQKNRRLSRCLMQAQETDGCDDPQHAENNFNGHDWPQEVAESRVYKHEIHLACRDQDGRDDKNRGDRDDRSWRSQRDLSRIESRYSSTLSSSFFLPQSAAACTKARTTGCGFFSVDESCGWKRVARKKR
jgi:hypothetical protein